MESENPESYMFHIPNIHLVDAIAENIGIPLVKRKTRGIKEEELQDIRSVLKELKPHIDGITTGAVASNYQKTRIDAICFDLGLASIAPFWGKDPEHVLRSMLRDGFEIMIVAVAAPPLNEEWLGRIVDEECADELVFYDITASSDKRTVPIDWVKKVAQVINIPFCVAGGISSIADARKILQNGADKISVNSPALENPALINNLVKEFGSQCVVVGIDSFEKNGDYFVKQYTGDPGKTKTTKWRTLDWADEIQKLGAGEIVLNCMNKDGTRKGYDLNQLDALSRLLTIPVVASGGAGSAEDFVKVFKETNVDAGLAASIFHSGNVEIGDLKKTLQENNIQVRL